jgi:hypothetical protein
MDAQVLQDVVATIQRLVEFGLRFCKHPGQVADCALHFRLNGLVELQRLVWLMSGADALERLVQCPLMVAAWPARAFNSVYRALEKSS